MFECEWDGIFLLAVWLRKSTKSIIVLTVTKNAWSTFLSAKFAKNGT